MNNGLEQLRSRMAEITDLRVTAHLLEWDQQTMMPPRGGPSRAESIATIERIGHERFVSEETGRLLEAAAAEVSGADPVSDDASLVRVVRRRWDKARRVPTELVAELAHAGSIGQEAWVSARARNDFDAFIPYLTRNLELARQYVECFDTFDCAYDVLLDDYDPGMKTAEVRRLFDELKAELVPMIAAVGRHADRADDALLHGEFPVDRQRQLVLEVVERMGFERSGWRLDDAVHPFATGLGSHDVRITNRWEETYFASSLFGAMHECGHGLYEDGVALELRRTPIGAPSSLALHESQSRLWENMVGRGRPFADVLAPRLGRLAGGELAGIEPDALYRAINSVKPSFIRVEADEATYSLHIILRFELEQELIDGRLAVADLPEAWNARFAEYLGLHVKDDAHGVLQDVHWSAGMLGYFPTYALGNLVAGQLWERARSEIDGLDELLAAGELSALREWLRVRVHRHGAKFETEDLLRREGGGPITVAPFVRYLKAKLSDVYGVDLSD